MEKYSQHQNDRKQQSAQHEKGNWVSSSQSNFSAFIFSSQSAIERMKKHLQRKEQLVIKSHRNVSL